MTMYKIDVRWQPAFPSDSCQTLELEKMIYCSEDARVRMRFGYAFLKKRTGIIQEVPRDTLDVASVWPDYLRGGNTC